MNKVSHINLGGYPFTIDEDAYDSLNRYLKTIHNHFRQSDGYEEITGDIESRLAEIFQETLGSRSIVTLKDVNHAISIMGTPEDFGATAVNEDDANTQKNKNTNESASTYRTGKRVFRDEDEAIVGGVCAGIAAYFGIQDPLWIRLFFIILNLGFGSGVTLYVILWIILPKAESSADRLAMRGEKINISNIAKIVEESAKNITEKVEKFGEELSDLGDRYQGSKKKINFNGDNARNAISKGVFAIGSAFAGAIEFLVKLIRPILIFIAVVLIIALLATWIGSMIGSFFAFPYMSYILPAKGLSFLGFTNLFFLIGIPIALLILFITRVFFNNRINNPYIHVGLWVFWTINLISLGGIGISTAKQFQQGTKNMKSFIVPTNNDTLDIIIPETPFDEGITMLGELHMNDDVLVSDNVRLNIDKSKSGKIEISEEDYSRGKNTKEAADLSEKINYQLEIKNNKLTINPNIVINKDSKWRNQGVTINLKVPEGKYIRFQGGRNLEKVIGHWVLANNDDYVRGWYDGQPQIWKMESNGLIWVNRPDGGEFIQGDIAGDKLFDFSDFKNISVKGILSVYIEKGDYYKVRCTGNDAAIEKVKINNSNGTLEVTSDAQNNESQLKIYITMPVLENALLENAMDSKIDGFKQDKMFISHRGNYDLTAYIDVDNLEISNEGHNNISLIGSGKRLKAKLGLDSKLEAKRYDVKVADIGSFGNSSAELTVSDTLYQKKDGGSNIEVVGKPVIIE